MEHTSLICFDVEECFESDLDYRINASDEKAEAFIVPRSQQYFCNKYHAVGYHPFPSQRALQKLAFRLKFIHQS